MSETLEPRQAAQSTRAEAAEPSDYQPPAIAWEEPLEAIAALTCLTSWGGCPDSPTG